MSASVPDRAGAPSGLSPAVSSEAAHPSRIAYELREARALIERGWAQGWFAKNEGGEDCSEISSCAVSWCTTGALFRVAREEDADELIRSLRRVLPSGYDGVVDWNDAPERTQAEVLAAFDKAIALAEVQS